MTRISPFLYSVLESTGNRVPKLCLGTHFRETPFRGRRALQDVCSQAGAWEQVKNGHHVRFLVIRIL